MLWKLKKIWYRIYQNVFRVAMYFIEWKDPQVLDGAGSCLKIPSLVKSKGLERVLVVTDKGLMGLHLLDPMLKQFENDGVKYFIYDGVQPNPTITNVEECLKVYKDNDCQGVVAFGGGSPMDCAKAAAARVVRPNKQIRQMTGILKVNKKLPPFVAVPTTAGTGSETTLAAVITDDETHIKYPINDPKLRPRYAVLDASLTVGLPPHVTSTTGMDALTHAVEAYIGHCNTAKTRLKAETAVNLIFNNLEKVYADGKDIEARENMLKASFYAGEAFTRAFVGYVHAVAHCLGGKYGVPHGLANAVILPYVLEFYGDTIHKSLARLCDKAQLGFEGSDAEKAAEFIRQVKRMNKAMNIPDKFDVIKEEDISSIAKIALKEANPTYPVPKLMNQQECEALVRSLMA